MTVALGLWARLLLPWLAGAGGGGGAGVNFRFASYIGDHMVLQKEPAGAVVWGYGQVGGIVMVTLYQAQETVMKKIAYVRGPWGHANVSEPSETWIVVLDPMKPGGPYNMTAEQIIKKKRYNQTVYDVLFGDVWLCSGQSNMEMSVSQIFNASEEEAKAFAYPFIRIFSVALTKAERELEDLTSVDLPWSLPTPKNLGHGNFTYYSAVCWLFGRHLYDTLKYPIGLVSSSWGGTPIEAWSSWRSLKACEISEEEKHLYTGPTTDSILWNSMIHPLLNMTLKGAIWYQGENNAYYNTDLYNCTFPALIEDWRQSFHYGSQGQTQRLFPFGFVQLSTTMPEEKDDGFPRIRWHQTADLGYVPNMKMPNTFMAVAMDLCDRDSPFGSIHPRDKQTVAYRLHLGARAIAYGEKMIPFQGPMPEKIELLADKQLLKLEYYQKIQVQKQDDKIFEILCCHDSQCTWIPAPMGNSSSQSLVLKVNSCLGTVSAVRYAWATWPCEYKQCPIYNPSSALPAPPFITVIPS